MGFKTSISIEPFLDKDPIPLIMELAPYVTESIWIGKMNYIKANNIIPDEKEFYDFQREISSWANIKNILANLQNLSVDIKSKIRLKDSIKNMKDYRILTPEYDISVDEALPEGEASHLSRRLKSDEVKNPDYSDLYIKKEEAID